MSARRRSGAESRRLPFLFWDVEASVCFVLAAMSWRKLLFEGRADRVVSSAVLSLAGDRPIVSESIGDRFLYCARTSICLRRVLYLSLSLGFCRLREKKSLYLPSEMSMVELFFEQRGWVGQRGGSGIIVPI